MISNDDVFGLACTAGALSHIVIGDVHGMLVVVHARCIVREPELRDVGVNYRGCACAAQCTLYTLFCTVNNIILAKRLYNYNHRH